jgi:hypothetical protein
VHIPRGHPNVLFLIYSPSSAATISNPISLFKRSSQFSASTEYHLETPTNVFIDSLIERIDDSNPSRGVIPSLVILLNSQRSYED